MECPLELDQMIKSMGEMTKGNIAMVQRYLNSEDSPKVDAINPRRQRRRRKKLN
jgi:hypothetical protein